MVSKKQTKITVELIAKRSVICVKPTMLQEKIWKRKKKISRPKKVQSVQEERSCPCPFKKRCQSNYRPALQRQPQEQHQRRLQHFQQNKFWAEVFTSLKDYSQPVCQIRPRLLEFLSKNSIYVELYIKSQEEKRTNYVKRKNNGLRTF